jgi:hypothetical protein
MDQTRALNDAIDDLPTARALIASLQEQLTTSQREVAALRHELDILCQRLFGKKSERVDPRQLKLALEQLANERGAVTEPVEMDSGDTPVRGHTRRRPTGRRPLPAHLPRRRVEIDIPGPEKQCVCGHLKTRIGEDVSEKLETVLDERGGSFKGRIWTSLDPLMNQVVFDATTTHERGGPAAFLADFRG